MAIKKRIKKKTLSEFMSWLEGIECLQEDDWAPNADQWRKIRDMLNHIKPNEVEVQQKPAGLPTLPALPGEPVARIVEPPAGFRPNVPVIPQHSQLEQPRPAKVQPMLQPSGVAPKIPTPKESLLQLGEEHQENEFL